MKHMRLTVILGLIGVTLATPAVVFFIRPPVLIVTDASFAALYGVSHLKQQRISASLSLFRQVKPVLVADGVSADLVSIAIADASSRPFCVLFPRSQAAAAQHYHGQFPEIPAIVMRGLATVPELPPPDGYLCVYGTDRETDLYRAGLCAGILGGLKKAENQAENQDEKLAEKQDENDEKPVPPKTYVLRQDRSIQTTERELFSQGLKEQDPDALIVFANTNNQIPDMKGISCLVIAGIGGDYLEKNPTMPIILFSWLNPAFSAQELVVQFDDSAWALAVPAVRLAEKGEAEGKIPSKLLVFPRKIADKNIVRLLKKSAKKMP
jgi:hypothetical protein